jgi:hypothetical protein
MALHPKIIYNMSHDERFLKLTSNIEARLAWYYDASWEERASGRKLE